MSNNKRLAKRKLMRRGYKTSRNFKRAIKRGETMPLTMKERENL